MFNDALFEYEMKIRNISKDDMCSKLGLSRSAFYRKRTGKSEWTYSEMQKIGDTLGKDAAVRIFSA